MLKSKLVLDKLITAREKKRKQLAVFLILSSGSVLVVIFVAGWHNLCPADRAPVLRFEPLLDAIRVELVKTRQREQLITLTVVRQADRALKIICLQLQ